MNYSRLIYARMDLKYTRCRAIPVVSISRHGTYVECTLFKRGLSWTIRSDHRFLVYSRCNIPISGFTPGGYRWGFTGSTDVSTSRRHAWGTKYNPQPDSEHFYEHT